MKQHAVFALSLILVVVLMAGLMTFLLRESAGCTELASSPATSSSEVGAHHLLVIELAGNGPTWQRELSDVVSGELQRTASMISPVETLDVELRLVRNGAVHAASQPCLKGSLSLRPSSGDLHAYEQGSEQTRENKLRTMRTIRQQQIGWLADAVADEVAVTNFDDIADDLVMSPLFLWEHARRLQSVDQLSSSVSIVGPMASTASDCLDLRSLSIEQRPESDELVQLCIANGQLEPLNGIQLSVLPVLAANPGNRMINASELATALCRHGVVDGSCLSDHQVKE